jgi:hypothetical protein
VCVDLCGRALAGVAAETVVLMLIYLDHAAGQSRKQIEAHGRTYTRKDLYDAIMIGAVERVRPKIMTVVPNIAGLLPMMWSTGSSPKPLTFNAAQAGTPDPLMQINIRLQECDYQLAT